jgi:hypothetical protein
MFSFSNVLTVFPIETECMKLEPDYILPELLSVFEVIVIVILVSPFFVREVKHELDVGKFGNSVSRSLSHVNRNQKM